MKPLSNIHTHTVLCDGKNTVAEMAEAAFAKGFVSLGFSAHSPLPYANNYTLESGQTEVYRQQVLAQQARYAGKMEILLGLEWDFDSPPPDFTCDYLIGAVHQLHPQSTVFAIDDTPAEFERCAAAFGSMRQMLEYFYARTVESALRPKVDVLAHFDLIGKFNRNNAYFDPAAPAYRSLALQAMAEILDKRPELLVEVNTGAMLRGYTDTPYPNETLLQYLAQRSADVVLSSDAHTAEGLDFGFDAALALCKKSGFSRLCRLRKNGREYYSL